jgi:histidinol-phosphatase (PHP family)
LVDYHVHTNFSEDAPGGQAEIDAVIESAIAKGLSEIAITDHSDPNYPDPEEEFKLDYEEYHKALLAAEKKYAERIRVVKGIEIGMIPGKTLRDCEEIISAFPYDFVIGSVHSAEYAPIHLQSFLGGKTTAQINDEYYSLLFDSIKNFKNYDVLGHINVIDRYTEGYARKSLYMPYIDEILKLAIADGKGIEINTSSYRYGMAKRGTPTPAILKRYVELGGEIVTLGSDAHRAVDVAEGIKEGLKALKAAGLNHYATYKNRQVSLVKI